MLVCEQPKDAHLECSPGLCAGVAHKRLSAVLNEPGFRELRAVG